MKILTNKFSAIKNPLGVTIFSYLMVFLLGFIDYLTNPEFSFSLFYLIPIVFNTWYLDRKNGVLISLVSSALWLYNDIASIYSFQNSLVPFWNSIIRFGIFFIIVFLLSEIKYFYLNLEKLVKDRTSELTEEIEKKNLAEDELTRSMNLYQDLVENINEVYYTTNIDGYLGYISPNFYKSTGFREAEIRDKNIYNFIHPGDRGRITDYYKSKLAGNESTAVCEFRIKGAQNYGKWFEQNSKIIVRNGEPVEIRNLLRNISERKAAEISLIKSEMKFNRLFSDEIHNPSEQEYVELMLQSEPGNIIRSLADRIDEVSENIGVRIKQALGFSSLASHELRTPLTIIRNQLEENLRSDIPLHELKEATASIYDEVLRLQRIIGDLLKLSKMEAGKFKLQKNVVDLDKYIKEFYEEAKLLAEDKKIEVILCTLEPVRADIDEAYFLQMFFNIFDNALKYTPENGSITIGYEVDKGTVSIFFRDTGIGIPSWILTKLFSPFYQNSLDNQPSGTGLGLLLAKWIAQLHNGDIKIQSEYNKGTNIIISIPVIPVSE
jgi:PAS domain S-box-containing protein